MKSPGLALCLLLNAGYVSAADVEDVLGNYMAAWSAHDSSKIVSFFAENVIWYDLPSDSVTQGKEAVGPAIVSAFLGQVDNMYWVRSGDTFVSGNTAIYEWTYGGTFNGNWGDTQVDDKTFAIKGLSTTTINDDGKIVAQKDYYDVASFAQALGVGQ
jgi:steroid delta-isomerase-like uncharacterized protein